VPLRNADAIVASAAFGVLAETLARATRLWLYRSPVYTTLNVIFMFGVVMGLLAALVPRRGAWLCFTAAAVVGFLYELANFHLLHWWWFPAGKFLIFRGELQISLALAVMWGMVPPLVAALRPPER